MVKHMANCAMSLADTSRCHGCYRLGRSSAVLDHPLAYRWCSIYSTFLGISIWIVLATLHWLAVLIRSIPPVTCSGKDPTLPATCPGYNASIHGLVDAVLGLQRPWRQVILKHMAWFYPEM